MSKKKETKTEKEETAVVDEEKVKDEEPAKEATPESETSKSTEEESKPESEEEESAPSLEEELDSARQEAAEFEDKWKRSVAELTNYKRRQEEQRKNQRDQIKSDVLQGVVSALDDLDLAFQNLPQELNGQVIGWVEGFRLVQRKLDKILEDQNVMAISTEGKFDPNFHEAVSYEDSNDHADGDIIGELRKGYQIGSRVIRPALVRVAK
jgi:molecular chaperone GrpE